MASLVSRGGNGWPRPGLASPATASLRRVRVVAGAREALQTSTENCDSAESTTTAGSPQDSVESHREWTDRVDVLAHLAREVRPTVSLGLRPDGVVYPGRTQVACGHDVVRNRQNLQMGQPGAPVVIVASRVPLVRVKPAQQAFETGDVSLDLGEDGGQLAFERLFAASVNSRHDRSYIQRRRLRPLLATLTNLALRACVGSLGRNAVLSVVIFAEEMLVRATVVLGDVDTNEDDREDAARVIQAILLRAHPTERHVTDVISALSRALDVELATRRVLGELQRLPRPQVESLARGVERLLEQAFRSGDHDYPLRELIFAALEEPAWAARIRDEWVKAAVSSAVEELPRIRYPVALLISGWLSERGAAPEWMRELVEERPELVSSTLLPPATRWQLHGVAPSVEGWKSLTGMRGMKPVLEPAKLGDRLDIAVTTLEQAVGETCNGPTAAVLQQWLCELTGVTR